MIKEQAFNYSYDDDTIFSCFFIIIMIKQVQVVDFYNNKKV